MKVFVKRLSILMWLLVLAAPSAFAMPQPVRWAADHDVSLTAQQQTKKDVLSRLKILQDRQITESTELENAIRKQLNDTMALATDGDDFTVASRRTSLVTKKIEELNKRRSELNARREIVDRLIFQIDSKWDSKSKLQDFLKQTFIEMAATDLADGRDNRLWKEFTYLSMVMGEVEQNEDALSLFQGYLTYASVLDPKTPADYLASRNYTNGAESQAARGTSRDVLGDGLTPPVQVIKGNLAHGDVAPPTPSQISVSATKQPETAAKAQADSGQVPMPALPAGAADSAHATSSSTSHSASDLATPPAPTPVRVSPPASQPAQH
jgi:hypothetical protein